MSVPETPPKSRPPSCGRSTTIEVALIHSKKKCFWNAKGPLQEILSAGETETKRPIFRVITIAGGPSDPLEVPRRVFREQTIGNGTMMSEIAFHEKAGRSQVSSFVFSLD